MFHPALPIRHFSESGSIELAWRAPPPSVDLESPARLVMTDLSDMTAMTIGPGERLREAEQRMVQQGRRVLFVVARMPHVMGMLTLADLQGEKPLRLVFERQLGMQLPSTPIAGTFAEIGEALS